MRRTVERAWSEVRGWSDRSVPLAILVVALGVTALVWFAARRHAEALAYDEFAAHVAHVESALERQLAGYYEALEGAAGLFIASTSVSREEWRAYVASVRLDGHPGMDSIGFIERATPAELPSLIARTRVEGFSGFSVWPAGVRARYSPVVRVATYGARAVPPRDDTMIGFDLESQPLYRPAMDRAIDSGRPAMTAPLDSPFAPVSAQPHPIVVLFMPVYRTDASLATVQQRRQGLRGFAYAVVRSADLIDAVVGPPPRRFDVEVLDRDVPVAGALLDRTTELRASRGSAFRPVFELTREMRFGGRTWRLRFSSDEYASVMAGRDEPLIVLAAGIPLSLMLFAIAWSQTTLRVRALTLAKAMTAALRASEERYALALEGSSEGHWDWRLESDEIFVSPRLRELFGMSRDVNVATGAQWREVMRTQTHPEDSPHVAGAVQDHFAGRTADFQLEHRVRRPDGTYHWVQSRGRAQRGPDGRVSRFSGSTSDISKRKEAEEEQRRLESRLHQAQKLEAIGTLAGGIAHDFNNILGAIIGYAELALDAAAHGSPQRTHLTRVMQASERASALIAQILAFSRRPAGERNLVSLAAVTREVLDLLAPRLGAAVRVETAIETLRASVRGDATALHEMVMNLCINAVQAMPTGGVLRISLRRAELAEPRVLTSGPLASGRYVVLSVADSGHGIAPDVLPRIFDPFFTTRAADGTGLGLSLVHGIVAGLGGAIDVHSVPGEGTTFIAYLPLAAQTESHVEPELRDTPRGSGQTILLVDDEEPLVRATEERLADLGYEPVGFSSARLAVEAFRSEPGRFDLVVTDQRMPELSGLEVARTIKQIRPDIAVLMMSGYPDEALAEAALAAGVLELLAKPVRAHELAAAIARALRLSLACQQPSASNASPP